MSFYSHEVIALAINNTTPPQPFKEKKNNKENQKTLDKRTNLCKIKCFYVPKFKIMNKVKKFESRQIRTYITQI